MIARSVLPFTLRGFLERGRLASVLGYRLSRWKHRFAALGDWDRAECTKSGHVTPLAAPVCRQI
jgi:hypothetical protein